MSTTFEARFGHCDLLEFGPFDREFFEERTGLAVGPLLACELQVPR